VDARIDRLEQFSPLGATAKHTGAGLSIEVSDGFSPGNIHENLDFAQTTHFHGALTHTLVRVLELTSALTRIEGSDQDGTASKLKKTGLVSQGVTEKPGEFSN